MKKYFTHFHQLPPNQQATSWWRRLSVALIISISLPALTFAQNKIWDKTYGGDGEDQLSIVQKTRDGGYILGGTSTSGKSGNKSEDVRGKDEYGNSYPDYWIVKLNADGSKAWDKTFGGSHSDELYAVQQTQDGGFILGGTSYSGKSGDKSEASKGGENGLGYPTSDYWIVKLNANGNKVWDKTIGGEHTDYFQSLQQTSDGGYILGGYSYSSQGIDKSEPNKRKNNITGDPTSDYWVVKLKANGSKEWDKTYGGNNSDQLVSVQQTADGGYILGGSTTSEMGGDKTQGRKGRKNTTDYWVIKLTNTGLKVWDKTIGGGNTDDFTAIAQTKDGGFLLGGTSLSRKGADKSEERRDENLPENAFGGDYWIVKLSSNGSKEWDKTYGSSGSDRLAALLQTNDGGYLLGGTSDANASGDKTLASKGGTDYWVIKLNPTGTKVWDKTIGGNSHDYLKSLQQTTNNEFVLAGSSESFISGDKSEPFVPENGSEFPTKDYWVVKIDNSGNNLSQFIDFEPISVLTKTPNDPPFALSAKASSGLPVTFKVISGPATIKGNILTITGVGIITVKATQAGNETYKAAPEVSQSLIVALPNPEKQWDATIGGSDLDNFTAMVPTPDGGYLLGGSSRSGISGDKSEENKSLRNVSGTYPYDYWIVKTDKTGKKVWDKTFGGHADDQLTALVATPDGGYLLGGTSTSPVSGDKTEANKGGTDYWVVKITADGTRQWDKTFGGNANDDLTSLLAIKDGYVVGGSSGSNQSGDKSENNKGTVDSFGKPTPDYWVVKLDNSGTKVWDKTYGGSKADNLVALVTTSNGDYLLGGSSASEISGDKSQALRTFKDYWLVRIKADGTKVWDKAYGGAKDSYPQSTCDPEEFPGPCPDRYFGVSTLSAMVTTKDGGFLLGGSSNAEKGNEKSDTNISNDIEGFDAFLKDYWVIKINDDGNKVWDKTFGGINVYHFDSYMGDSQLTSLLATPEGDFLLGGFSNSDKGGEKSEDSWRISEENLAYRYDYWVVKIDGNGNKKWDKIFGGLYHDYLAAIVPASDGGYVLGGSSQSILGADKSNGSQDPSTEPYYRSDYWLVKIKGETTPEATAWNMRYGGLGTDNLTDVIKTSDGGYLAGGYSASGNSGDRSQNSQGKNDYWIVKSDKNGKKLWDKRYGGSDDDYLNRVIQTQDGGYLLAGSSLSGKSGDKSEASKGDRDYWIVKVDAQGNKQWDKTFGGSGFDQFVKVIQLSTGELVLGGTSKSPVSGDVSQASPGLKDYWLVKITSTGTKIWDKRYGGKSDDQLGSFTQTQAGGFLLAGYSLSGANGDKSQTTRGNNDYWVIKTDKNGVKVWDKTFGGNSDDIVSSVAQSGSGYYISGTSRSGVSGDKSQASLSEDYWLVKMDQDGRLLWEKTFGGSQNDELRASTSLQDGGIVLGGSSYSEESGSKSQTSQGSADYWIVRVDTNGNKVYDKRFGGSGRDELRTIFQTSEGGLLLAGWSDSNVSGDKTQPCQGGNDYWLVKLAPETSPMVANREVTHPEIAAPITNLQVQAYPNPVQDKATISFTLPETQQATVKVYDGQGNEVATLFNGEAKANQQYEVEWKAGNKPAGLYFLQLQTPALKHQQKLLLTK